MSTPDTTTATTDQLEGGDTMLDVLDWRMRAACRDKDPEMFYPVGDAWVGEANARRADQAKAVCAGCPVRTQCLVFAVESGDEFAVLGGTLPEERRKSRARERARTA